MPLTSRTKYRPQSPYRMLLALAAIAGTFLPAGGPEKRLPIAIEIDDRNGLGLIGAVASPLGIAPECLPVLIDPCCRLLGCHTRSPSASRL
jgi:hypothetical protein